VSEGIPTYIHRPATAFYLTHHLGASHEVRKKLALIVHVNPGSAGIQRAEGLQEQAATLN